MNLKISNFLKGIISLVISQILIKIFGVIYTLYITNKSGFGDQGNAIYMSGYQIYALLLTISSIGVPNAISKIISEKKSIKDTVNEKRILLISIMLFAIIGFLGTIILFFGADIIANNILMIPKAKLSIKVLSPAVFFVSVASVFRGYFNGKDKIQITALSQFIEQLLKSILTIIFVEITDKISNNNTEVMAAAANFATTVATCMSLLLVLKKYINLSKGVVNGYDYKKESISQIIKSILIISIPITTSAILSSIGKNIDSITIVRILKNILGEETAINRYGILSSKVDVLISFPLAFNIAVSTALIPEISKLKIKNDIEGVIQKINLSLTISIIIGIPCTVGMFFYSEQIFELLFPNALAGSELLKIASIAIIFSLLTQTINGVLQGIGKNNIPLIASIVGIALKILCNIILVPIQGIYEKGAIIGNIISSIASFIIVCTIMEKNVKTNFNFITISLKSILSSIVMILASYKMYIVFTNMNINKKICIINSLIIAVIVYFFLIFLNKILKKSKILKVLKKGTFKNFKL